MPIATNDAGETVFLDGDGQWKPAQTAVNPQTKETLAFDGREWSALPQRKPSTPAKGAMGYLDDAVRALANGATFGWADEIAAGGNALLGRGDYASNLEAEKARTEQVPSALRIPGEVAGAVGGAIAAAPALAPAAALTGISRLPALARSVMAGTAGGAAFGAGDADPGGRLEGAGKGAATGALVGYAAPYLIRGASIATDAVRNAVSPRANVAADLGRALTRDADTPAALAQRAADLALDRPGVATLADAGGENVRGLMERVAQTPGAGRTTVVPFITDRQQGQMARVASDLRGLTGTHKTAREAIEDTIARRAQAAKPLYDQAFQFDAATSPEVMQAWQATTATGWGRAALNSPTLKKTLQTEYGVQNVADAPLMVQIDAWKKTVDDAVSAAVRGGNANQARVLTVMRDRMLQVVDQANPAYASARNAWAGPSQYLDAVESGRNILSGKLSAEELKATLAKMSEAEREAYRIGAVSSIQARMGNDTAKLGDMTKYLRSPETRAKLAAIMPTEEAAQSWTRRLDFEIGASELAGRALGNSATARRLAERADADGIVGDLVLDALSGSGGVGFLRRILSAGPQRIRDTLRSRSDDLLARVLTDPQADLTNVLNRVRTGPRVASDRTSGTLSSGMNAAIADYRTR